MRLLVTGGAGYVGSVCDAHLVEAGHEVVVLDDLSTGHRDAVPPDCKFVEGELGAAAGHAVLEEGVSPKSSGHSTKRNATQDRATSCAMASARMSSCRMTARSRPSYSWAPRGQAFLAA